MKTENKEKGCDLEQLLRDLGNPSDEVRNAAMRRTRSLSSEELLRLAQMELSQFRQCRSDLRISGLFLLLGGSVSASLMLFMLTALLGGSGALGGILLELVGALWLIMGAQFYEEYHQAARAHNNLSLVAGDLNDVRTLPMALTRLRGESGYLNVTILSVIKKMLPNVRADQAKTWTQEQKRALVSLLDPWLYDDDLTLRALRALEQVGDESAMPSVRYLSMSHNSRIRDAAQHCLLYLQTQMDRRRQAQTLLRPSGENVTVRVETLLRPAESYVAQTPPEELLRPLER